MIRIAEKDTFHIMAALSVDTIIHWKNHYIFFNQHLETDSTDFLNSQTVLNETESKAASSSK